MNFFSSVFKCSLLIVAFFFQNSSYCQTFNSSNLPIIIIKTSNVIPNDYKLEGNISIIDNGAGKINNVTDIPNNYKGKIGIETRGSSSQYFYPKKSYGFETWNDLGEDLDTTLLGLPSQSDWILYAPYGDKSMLRDVLTYHLANKTGRYASRSRFCELVVNDEYMGVYVLLEKVKRDKNRVNISKLTETDTAGSDVTGGYILKIDRQNPDGGDGFHSKYSIGKGPYYIYDYPSPNRIHAKQEEYIRRFFNEFETALKGNNFRDPHQGYAAYIDVPSFIDYFMITEFTRNIDAFRLSTFMYKEKKTKGNKLYMGPLWDYNLAYGNANYCNAESYTGWAKDHAVPCPGEDLIIPFWWNRLLQDPAYEKQLKDRYSQLRKTFLKSSFINNFLDSTAAVLEEAQKRNYQKWPILGVAVWPNYYVGQTYKEEVDYLKWWIDKRLTWLDKEWESITPIEKNPSYSDAFHSFPNPFEKSIVFKYSHGYKENTFVKIFDLSGNEITKLRFAKGSSNEITCEWNGTVKGVEVSNGMYISALEVDGKLMVRKKIYKVF